MQKLDAQSLTGPRETLLIPLWARAAEAAHPDPILLDPKAVEMVEAIDYDFDKFRRLGGKQAGYCIRSVVFDTLVRQFLEQHPAGTVVEIGAGLDTRFERIENGSVRWFDLDLPEVIDLRRTFFDESPRRTFLSGSALDPRWIDAVEADAPVNILFVAEGVFYFLTSEQIAGLFALLADHFPGSSIVFDSQSRLFLWYSKLTHPIQGARLLTSVTSPREVQRWDRRFHLEESIGFGDSPHYDRHFGRLPLLYRVVRRLIPASREMFRVSRVRLAAGTPASAVDAA